MLDKRLILTILLQLQEKKPEKYGLSQSYIII